MLAERGLTGLRPVEAGGHGQAQFHLEQLPESNLHGVLDGGGNRHGGGRHLRVGRPDGLRVDALDHRGAVRVVARYDVLKVVLRVAEDEFLRAVTHGRGEAVYGVPARCGEHIVHLRHENRRGRSLVLNDAALVVVVAEPVEGAARQDDERADGDVEAAVLGAADFVVVGHDGHAQVLLGADVAGADLLHVAGALVGVGAGEEERVLLVDDGQGADVRAEICAKWTRQTQEGEEYKIDSHLFTMRYGSISGNMSVSMGKTVLF